ncbi:hypothetical protein ELQ90_11315 [Labedella phragmitis]|uniref:Uncharacterized protein n=1 Tax=Labedella phragmitis TaxID=2498849 RepID=A0A3S4A2D9_9MICO|nr:DUF6350 family protein [Labedella phragmitis]RWZ49930.1 hypothetical protein ELQ90_11315 [Labedella phragmitis]
MNRTTVALLAALEAFIVVAIGIAIALVPLTLLWAVQYGFAIDWAVFWRAAVDVWLLGHGADLTVALDPLTIARLGVLEAGEPFTVSLAPLGIGLVTVLLGARTGRRAADSGLWLTGVLSATLTVVVLSAVLSVTAREEIVSPSLLGGIGSPPLVYLVGLAVGLIGARLGRGDEPIGGRVGEYVERTTDRIGVRGRAIAAASLRGGAIVAAGIVGAAAVTVAIVLFASFGTVIGLYESSGMGITGGIAVTIAQLAYLPNLVVWCAAWLLGPGFAIGVGTSVSPATTLLGPVPGIPVLGAIPAGDLPFGFLGLIVPVLVGFLAAAAVRPAIVRAVGSAGLVRSLVLTAVGIALVASVLMGLLALASSGAMGPERLQEVGPAPLAVALATLATTGVAALVGMASGRYSSVER